MTYHFGPTLRELRQAANVTQRSLAIRIKASNANVCQYETEARIPSIATVRLIATALNLPPMDRWRLLESANYLPPIDELALRVDDTLARLNGIDRYAERVRLRLEIERVLEGAGTS